MKGIKQALEGYLPYKETDRYYSWNLCYDAFQKYGKNPKADWDLLALHLGMYLASWGMMRGSAKLLAFSYKVHIPVVTVLLKDHPQLFGEKNMDELKTCLGEVISLPAQIILEYENSGWKQTITGTLATKIILGVFGLCPAYDRYFKDGINCYNDENPEKQMTQKFGEESLVQLIEFYETYETEFEAVNKAHGTSFPPMKLVDMYFWSLGQPNQNKGSTP